MGLSSKKSTVKTTENSTQNATVTPQNPDWVTGPLSEYTARIGAFGDMDPMQFVAPASPLQERAWGAAGNLGGWQGQAALASRMAARGGNAPANLAGRAANVNAPILGNASTIQATGYGAPTIGASSGYAAPRVGAPIGTHVAGYQTTGAANETISPIREASAQTGAQNTQNYYNPYTRDVVNTSLADMDRQAGSIRARQASEAAMNGSFAGSRYGIREAETEGELARARAATEAGLRSAAFDKSVGFGMADADRATQTSMFNAGSANTRDLAQADMNNRTSLFNADSANRAGEFYAGALNQGNMFNADAANRAVLTQAGLDSEASQFGANASNQFKLAQAGLNADAAQFGANAANQAGQFNAGAQNQFALTQAGLNADAGMFNADAANRFSLFDAGQRDNAQLRQLQAAGMLSDMSSSAAGNVRSDLALMSDMGAQQQAIEQAFRTAPLSQLQGMGQLYGATPYDLFKGVNTTGTNIGNSTSVTKSSGNPLGSAIGLASMFIPAGGLGGLFGGAASAAAPAISSGFGVSTNRAFNNAF